MSQGKTVLAPRPNAEAIWNVPGLLRLLERMTLCLRGEAAPAAPNEQPAAALDGRPGLGWWVLAQGEVLDDGNFASREAARDRLLSQVRRAGLLVEENVWVWDENWCAQLVLATLPTQARAWRVAERLREKGLKVRVRREMP